MSLYRRINELGDATAIEAFAAEIIDRFGPLPEPTENLLTLMGIKLNARAAQIAKIDVGAKGALVTFWNDSFPNVEGLLGYVDRLKGIAKLRPDMKLSISREWDGPKARLNGALQLSKGLAKLLA
jgi:transcription-repair coupling factor (superfamily II helicase)